MGDQGLECDEIDVARAARARIPSDADSRGFGRR